VQVSSLFGSSARPRRRLAVAGGAIVVVVAVVLAGVLGLGGGSSSAQGSLAKRCPSPSLVTSTLKQPIDKSVSNLISYGDTTVNSGTRLTCTYTTKAGTDITYTLSSNVTNPIAIVMAEEAGFGKIATFSGGAGFAHHQKAQVVPAFGPGKIAWSLKQGEILSALYGRTHLLIVAKGASEAELEALAKSTLGVPQANLRVQKAT
jgi:hypothetical protein